MRSLIIPLCFSACLGLLYLGCASLEIEDNKKAGQLDRIEEKLDTLLKRDTR